MPHNQKKKDRIKQDQIETTTDFRPCLTYPSSRSVWVAWVGSIALPYVNAVTNMLFTPPQAASCINISTPSPNLGGVLDSSLHSALTTLLVFDCTDKTRLRMMECGNDDHSRKRPLRSIRSEVGLPTDLPPSASQSKAHQNQTTDPKKSTDSKTQNINYYVTNGPLQPRAESVSTRDVN